MSWDVEDKAAEASKGADAARCCVPVRPHTHGDPAPLAVAESADGAGGGRDAERGVGGQGCWRSAAGGGHLVHLGHGAQPRVALRRGPRRALLDRHRLLREEQGEPRLPANSNVC